jgi:heptosyltransferase II
MSDKKRILVIQTAFIGDCILATALIKDIASVFPDSEIDILIRKGNEQILENNPFIKELLIWNKEQKKYRNMLRIIGVIRRKSYHYIFNIQRFASTGLITLFSGAEKKYGFKKNPFSFAFSKSFRHEIDTYAEIHEIERNSILLQDFGLETQSKPQVYPSEKDYQKVHAFKESKYICIAPASVWFTKQYPADQWISFLDALTSDKQVYIIGSGTDRKLGEMLIEGTKKRNIVNLCGTLSLLESAALMKDAVINYVNDSAPLHLASAVDAPLAAIFCSTVPGFGFGPLSKESYIIENQDNLACRPCGLHGKKECPEKHFGCARKIRTEQLLAVLNAVSGV